MLEQKYFYWIIIIAALIAIYYLYEEINSLKKIMIPTYQKSMAMENVVIGIEKKIENTIHNYFKQNRKNPTDHDSPVLSITYRSDVVGNDRGNLSIKYTDLDDSKANDLMKKIKKEGNNIDQINMRLKKHLGISGHGVKKTTESEGGINIQIETDKSDFSNLLNGLAEDNGSEYNENNDNLDSDAIKSISDSLQATNLPPEHSLSELPKTLKKNVKKNS